MNDKRDAAIVELQRQLDLQQQACKASVAELVDALEALLVQSPSTSEALPAIRNARELINKHRT